MAYCVLPNRQSTKTSLLSKTVVNLHRSTGEHSLVIYKRFMDKLERVSTNDVVSDPVSQEIFRPFWTVSFMPMEQDRT